LDKLWRNAQARREVIGQILDYAKDLSLWSYEDLEAAIMKASGGKGLYSIIADRVEEIDEAQFIDSVSKNLKRGRFLLLIVGLLAVVLSLVFVGLELDLNLNLNLNSKAIYTTPWQTLTDKLSDIDIIEATDPALSRIVPPAETDPTSTE
jgi:hypothetical protein